MSAQMRTGKRSIEILLVEDNLGDVALMREVMKTSRFPIRLNVVRNGMAALHYLFHRGDFHNSREPDLILLDLNLPMVDGREVLAQIKKDAQVGHIPVLVMTSSTDETDLAEAYKNNANFYITKPEDLDQYMAILKYIEDFWLERVKF